MTRRPKSPFLTLERAIVTDERGSVVSRWRYGHELAAAKAGRTQLPHGFLGDRIKEAARAGIDLNRTELQRRLRLAEAYPSEAKLRHAVTQFGTWRALVDAGFPPVVSDEPDEVEAAGFDLGSPDRFEQLSLTIPGLSETLSVHGQKIPLVTAAVADVRAYCETYRQIHENFGKRLGRMEFALGVMTDGSNGDDSMNAVEAWRLGCQDA